MAIKVLTRERSSVQPIYRDGGSAAVSLLIGYLCSCGGRWDVGGKAVHGEGCASYLPPKEKPKRKRKRKIAKAK